MAALGRVPAACVYRSSMCVCVCVCVCVCTGAPFDPLGFSQRPDEFIDQTVKEIRHGRLAMVAMLGYAVQVGTLTSLVRAVLP